MQREVKKVKMNKLEKMSIFTNFLDVRAKIRENKVNNRKFTDFPQNDVLDALMLQNCDRNNLFLFENN